MQPKGHTNLYALPIWAVHIYCYDLLSSHLFIISIFELIMLLHPETQTHRVAGYVPATVPSALDSSYDQLTHLGDCQ